MVEVEILGCVVTAQYGTLKQGDIVRTSAEFARHLVADCGAAKYTQAKPAVEAVADEPKTKKQAHKA